MNGLELTEWINSRNNIASNAVLTKKRKNITHYSEGDRNESAYKRLWYQIRSYLVKEEEEAELLYWLKEQHFMGRWFPEGHHCFNDPNSVEQNWKKVYRDKKNNNVIAEVLPTTEGHRWETEIDEEDQPSYLAPREYIYLNIKLAPLLNLCGQITCR